MRNKLFRVLAVSLVSLFSFNLDVNCQEKSISPISLITSGDNDIRGTGGLSSNLTGDMYRYQGEESVTCTYDNGTKQTTNCDANSTKIIEVLDEDNEEIYIGYKQNQMALANYIAENDLLNCNIINTERTYSSCQEYSGTKLEDGTTCHYPNDYEIEGIDGDCENIFELSDIDDETDIYNYTKSEEIENIATQYWGIEELKYSVYQNILNSVTEEDTCNYYNEYEEDNITCSIYDDVQIENKRINNYICIGSNTCQTSIMTESSYDDNTYRIIGITEYGRMKVIKMGFSNFGDGEFDSLQWSWNSTGAGKSYDWTNATVRTKLNNTGAGYYLASLGTYANYIDSSSLSKFYSTKTIDVSNPSYVPYDENSNNNYAATSLYALETAISSYGANEVDNNGYGYKVGLMQLSDYYLAASDSADCSYVDEENVDEETQRTCSLSWINAENNDGRNDNAGGSEWLITRSEDEASFATYNGMASPLALTETSGVRPVFYLKSDIQLKGNGTKESPYYIVTD